MLNVRSTDSSYCNRPKFVLETGCQLSLKMIQIATIEAYKLWDGLMVETKDGSFKRLTSKDMDGRRVTFCYLDGSTWEVHMNRMIRYIHTLRDTSPICIRDFVDSRIRVM